MIKKKIIIATGGTGGHVFPAYSLANFLIKKDFNVKLTSDLRGYKYLKHYQNLNIIKISSSPLVKKNLIKFLYSLFLISFSIIKSFLLLLFDRPSIVIGMGGYSSFPVCIAAFILRIKFIIYENNLIIGKANKYLLPFSKAIFVSYKELEGISKKNKYKIIEVGNIVREEIINSKFIKKDDRFSVLNLLVLGGSQSAKVFAEQLPQILKKIKNSGIPIKVYQQCQHNQMEKLSKFYKEAQIDSEIFSFTARIINYYQKANLVITRSGASALGELVTLKIPFISIPLPTSADNHQYKNAKFYLKKGFGYLVDEQDIKNKLYDQIKSIFYDKSLVNNILSNQKQYLDKEIFINLYSQLEKILYETN